MATFVWDPAVRWPPPANILLNYDVVPPDPPSVQARDAPNVLHSFVPIHDALRVAIVDRDASSPKEEPTPMPKVVIVGELYEQNVQVGGGPMPGGGWSIPATVARIGGKAIPVTVRREAGQAIIRAAVLSIPVGRLTPLMARDIQAAVTPATALPAHGAASIPATVRREAGAANIRAVDPSIPVARPIPAMARDTPAAVIPAAGPCPAASVPIIRSRIAAGRHRRSGGRLYPGARAGGDRQPGRGHRL